MIYMNLKRKKILEKLTTIGTTLSLIAMQTNYCLATGSIGTAEVTTATESIKRVIISIAMPLGRCINICKCCYCCNKNDN